MPAHAPSDPGHRVATALRLLCCGLMTGLAPISARAQEIAFKPPVQLETRVDLLGGPPAGAQLGVGANVAAGYYLRVGADVAAGAALRDGGGVASGRVDIVTRYLLDPFHELRWGPYAGGGFHRALGPARELARATCSCSSASRGLPMRGWRTSVELGLGGGARLGVVLRRARLNGR